ncbi:MAG: ABC transporter substrate-binding protein [Nitrososphaerota archaeon]|nr:ABC transporter substrate-binding protein [Nitrososphaerota archaeon]
MASSKTIAIIVIALVVGAAIGAGAITLMGSLSTSSSSVKTYTIGAILPLSGSFAAFGKSMTNAVNLAVQQMNANLTASNIPIQFKVITEDDSGTAAGALSAMQTLYQSDGVQVVIGPLTTPEVQGILQYSTQNHIVSLPPAVGTIGTSYPDNVFETGEPNSFALFNAMSQSVIQLGIKNVVFLYRQDTAETAVYNYTGAILKTAGVNVKSVSFAPAQSDYSAEVSATSADVQSIISSGGTYSNTAVFLAGLGTEASNIMTHASVDQYLSKVRWFGVAADADQTLLNDQTVGPFMAKVNFTIPLTYTQGSPQGQNYANNYKAVYGSAPEPYANYAYDNAWIGMESIIWAGSNNGKVIASILPTVADHYFQVTGTGTYVDSNGNQVIAFYNVGVAERVGTSYQFVSVGLYNYGTNTLTLNAP